MGKIRKIKLQRNFYVARCQKWIPLAYTNSKVKEVSKTYSRNYIEFKTRGRKFRRSRRRIAYQNRVELVIQIREEENEQRCNFILTYLRSSILHFFLFLFAKCSTSPWISFLSRFPAIGRRQMKTRERGNEKKGRIDRSAIVPAGDGLEILRSRGRRQRDYGNLNDSL